MSKDTIKLSGMTCASCAQRIQKSVGKMDGVIEANVNFATEKLIIEYDDNKVKKPNIKETIEKIGYGVIEDSSNNEVTIPIEGMTCASCSQRIEKTLNKLEGVSKATVNLATEKAVVEYDPSIIRLSAIKQSIEKIGYKPLDIENQGQVDQDRVRKEKEIKTLFRKFIVAIVFAIPLLYLAMTPMISWWPIPLPE
ncbi:MAG: copper ion binding protein, partial [Clostridiales bacterium]|nr:copper ion binding protein [Clostridiales bacterium]